MILKTSHLTLTTLLVQTEQLKIILAYRDYQLPLTSLLKLRMKSFKPIRAISLMESAKFFKRGLITLLSIVKTSKILL